MSLFVPVHILVPVGTVPVGLTQLRGVFLREQNCFLARTKRNPFLVQFGVMSLIKKLITRTMKRGSRSSFQHPASMRTYVRTNQVCSSDTDTEEIQGSHDRHVIPTREWMCSLIVLAAHLASVLRCVNQIKLHVSHGQGMYQSRDSLPMYVCPLHSI